MADTTVAGHGEWRWTEPKASKITLLKAAGQTTDVTHSVIDGQAIFEGDIVLSRGLETLGVVITGPGVRWPNRTVVYDIHAGLSNPNRVTDAIEHWKQRTSLRFTQRTNETDYILFREGGGCSSAVGRIGGVQHITLAPGCSTGNAIHEIGHAVALWHEQSREDRDTFIQIQWANIQANARHNFDQHITDGDDVGEYDYGSIMHYPRNAFAIDPSKPTIVTPNGQPIGQRDGLSPGDIAAVEKIYA